MEIRKKLNLFENKLKDIYEIKSSLSALYTFMSNAVGSTTRGVCNYPQAGSCTLVNNNENVNCAKKVNDNKSYAQVNSLTSATKINDIALNPQQKLSSWDVEATSADDNSEPYKTVSRKKKGLV